MKRNELHNQIDLLLEKLIVNNKNLSAHEGKFSQLETDLLRKQCIELYDAINQLHLVNMMDKSSQPVIDLQTKEAEIKEIKREEVKAEPILEPVIKVEMPTSIVEIEEEKVEPEIEPIVEKIQIPVVEIKSTPSYEPQRFEPVAEKPIAVVVPDIKPKVEEKSILDKITEAKSGNSLHETLSSKKEENELSHRFANSKIASIKSAIDISKRFELQSNLFGGDSNAYNNSLSEMDNASNKENALELFNSFASKYHWKHDNELAMELKSFIYRKYHS